MSDLQLVKNTTGSHLNRYTMNELSNGDIELTFHPGEDYVPGSPFDESFMNPLIRKVNAHDLDPIRNVELSASQFKSSSDYAMYPYCVDLAVQGLLETDYPLVTYTPDTLNQGCMAGQGKSMNGIIRLYAYSIPSTKITIDSIFIIRRGVE